MGLPAFQLPMFAKCDCRKEICSTCLFKASIPLTPFGNSNHKLPTRSRFLRATVHSAFWLHHAHPFVELPAFQLPMFAKCDCRNEICSTCLFKESIPATPFGNSNHKLPTRSRFLRAATRSTTSALWLHHAHPFVAARKNLSHAENKATNFTNITNTP